MGPKSANKKAPSKREDVQPTAASKRPSRNKEKPVAQRAAPESPSNNSPRRNKLRSSSKGSSSKAKSSATLLQKPSAPSSRSRSVDAASKKQKTKLLTVDSFLPAESAESVLSCGNGDVGQLGHGEDVTIAKRPRLVKMVPKDARFLQAVAGGMHSVVLTTAYEVYTCGCNDEGALGRPCCDDDGEQVDKDEDFLFRKVDFPAGATDILMISAGDSHTAALTRNGSVFVWGTFRDKGGQLGLALQSKNVGQVVKKTKEPFLLSSHKDRVVVKIASGSNHIAMLTTDGRIFTSGAGDAGQLGRLTPHSRDSAISQRTVAKMMTPTEIAIKLSIHFVDIWCATYCSFARSTDGKIFVWGLNNYCQLGVNDTNKMDIHFPELSQRFEPEKFWKGFAGDHHILAVDSSGKCYGIGRGDDCKLGQGEENANNSDALVEISSSDVAGVAAATGTSFFWTTAGQAFAWGANNEAELGLAAEEGGVVEKPTLIEVRGLERGARITQISANAQHTLFLASPITEGGKNAKKKT